MVRSLDKLSSYGYRAASIIWQVTTDTLGHALVWIRGWLSGIRVGWPVATVVAGVAGTTGTVLMTLISGEC